MLGDVHGASDLKLIRAWHSSRNAMAFQELVRRYAGFVYATCKRILRTESDAEDVAQQCFVALATDGTPVRVSVAAYLHRMATHRSLDFLRNEHRRHQREARYVEAQSTMAESDWDDVQGFVDEAIDELPEELRCVLVAHFIEGASQSSIARNLGLSRRVVGYRLQKAVDQVRDQLRARGISVGAAALAAMLAGPLLANTAAAAPASLAAALGKLSVSGAWQTGAGGSASGAKAALATAGTFGLKSASLVLALVAIAGVAAWNLTNRSSLHVPANQPSSIEDQSFAQAGVGAGAAAASSTPVVETERSDVEAARETQTGGGSSDGSSPELAAGAAVYAAGSGVPTLVAIRYPTDYARVEGWVRRISDGMPVTGTNIQVRVVPRGVDSWRSDVESKEYTGRSDESGHFSVGGIAVEGSGTVTVEHNEYVQTRLVILDTAPASAHDVAIEMCPGMTIQGRLLDHNRHPITDARVRVVALASDNGGATADTPLSNDARTNEIGMFRLTVSLVLGEGALMAIEVTSPTHGVATFTDIRLQNPRWLTLEFPQPASLHGVVRRPDGAGASGLTITLIGALRQGNPVGGYTSVDLVRQNVTIDASGQYRFDNLNPTLEYMIEIADGDRVLVARQRIQPLLPGNDTEWNYTLGEPAVITGVLRGRVYRRPLADMQVLCVEDQDGRNGPTYTAPTDSEGRYRFEIRSGVTRVRLIPRARSEGSFEQGEGEAVRVEPGREVTANLLMAEPWSIAFQIVDPSGSPIGGANVSVRHQWGDTASEYGVSPSDNAGYVHIDRLQPGAEVSVRCWKNGFIDAESRTYTGNPAQAVGPEVVVMYGESAMTALLVDADGAPLTETDIDLSFNHGDTVTTLHSATDGRGELSIPGKIPATTCVVELVATRPSADGPQTLLYRSDDVTFSAGVTLDFGAVVMDATE